MLTVYDVFRKVSTREIVIREDGAAVPAGFVAWGTFTDDDTDVLAPFHHIRDLLFADGELDPSSWSIKRYAPSMTVQPAAYNCDLSDLETIKVKPVFPFEPNDPVCTFVSSAPAVATVAADGTVTPVAVGTTNITVTNTQSGKSAICAITVSA